MKAYIESLGIIAPKAVYRNLTPAQLVEHALARGEGKLANTGARRDDRQIHRPFPERPLCGGYACHP